VVDASSHAIFVNRIDAGRGIEVGIGIDSGLTNRPRVENRFENRRAREYFGSKCRVRHEADDGLRQALSDAFVIHEEERAIPRNRSAEVRTELVHAERRDLRGVEWRARIQRVVAKELEGCTVKNVRAGLRDGVHLRAAGRAAFGRVHGRLHSKLRDRFERNVQARIGLLTLLLDAGRIDAVEGEVVVVASPSDESDVALAAAAGIDGARGERLERGPVAAVDRNVVELLVLENRSHPRVGGFERRNGGLHLKLFRDGS